MTILKGRIINGIDSIPLQQGLIAFENDKIVFCGKSDDFVIPAGSNVITVENGTILPGLIDCHAHLCGTESVNSTGKSIYDCLLTAAHDMGELTDSGVTGVRDMSSFGPALAQQVDAMLLRGPRVMPGGRVISPTAGHVDEEGMTVEQVNSNDLCGYLADGADGCLKAVRQQFRMGAKFIKICATGGVSSSIDNPNDVQFSPEELKIMIDEAHRHNSYVAAHCTGLAGAKQAIKAGVHSVEHGVNLDEECVELMKANDITLVSTCFVPFTMPSMTGIPDFMRKKGIACIDAIKHSYTLAKKAGVSLAMGTDFSNSKNTSYHHIGMELYYICQCGYTPMEAIQAATKNGAYLMNMQDVTGTLEAGKLADIIICDGDPSKDIKLLGDACHIKHVWQGGRQMK